MRLNRINSYRSDQPNTLSRELRRNSNILFVRFPVYQYMYVEILPRKWIVKKFMGTDILTLTCGHGFWDGTVGGWWLVLIFILCDQ